MIISVHCIILPDQYVLLMKELHQHSLGMSPSKHIEILTCNYIIIDNTACHLYTNNVLKYVTTRMHMYTHRGVTESNSLPILDSRKALHKALKVLIPVYHLKHYHKQTLAIIQDCKMQYNKNSVTQNMKNSWHTPLVAYDTHTAEDDSIQTWCSAVSAVLLLVI